MDSQSTLSQDEDTSAEQQLQQLVSDLHELQQNIENDVIDTPTAVLVDCYSEEYTVHTVKNLNSRAADLQGQVARLTAEAAQARANALAFRKRVSLLHERIQTIEETLQHIREEKDAVARQMESTISEVEVAQEELNMIKIANSDMVRSQGHSSKLSGPAV